MKLLDLYCGIGAASDGYYRSGSFDEIVGVDINPAHRAKYPYEFIEANVFDLEGSFVKQFDLVHASPPCQGYADGWFKSSRLYASRYAVGGKCERQVEKLREWLNGLGVKYVIENIDTAPMEPEKTVLLCGTWFRAADGNGGWVDELGTVRHRLFETNWGLENSYWAELMAGRLCFCERSSLVGQSWPVIGEEGWVGVHGGTGREYRAEGLDGEGGGFGADGNTFEHSKFGVAVNTKVGVLTETGRIGRTIAAKALGMSGMYGRGGFDLSRGSKRDLNECIPPAYTEYIGTEFLSL